MESEQMFDVQISAKEAARVMLIMSRVNGSPGVCNFYDQLTNILPSAPAPRHLPCPEIERYNGNGYVINYKAMQAEWLGRLGIVSKEKLEIQKRIVELETELAYLREAEKGIM